MILWKNCIIHQDKMIKSATTVVIPTTLIQWKTRMPFAPLVRNQKTLY